jgi:rod shape-determining protein MreD
MKFYILLFVTLIVSLIFQLLFMGYLSVFGSCPQIMLVSVIFVSLRYGVLPGEVFGFISGLLLDTFSLSIFGVNSLVFTLTGYAYGVFSKKIDENKIEVQILLAFLASCLQFGAVSLASAVCAPGTGARVLSVAAGLLYTTVLTPPLIKLYEIWIVLAEKWSGKTNQD